MTSALHPSKERTSQKNFKHHRKDNKDHNPSQLWSRLIIDQLVKTGLTHFFCTPGMRNAPLLRAITQNKKAQSFMGFDERAQSYRALGFAKASQGPVALVCTSGTAVANYLPAVIEAQKSKIPLVILSADRPGELTAIDANQTIDQTEVLRNYCKNFWMCSPPQKDYPPRALSGRLCYLIHDSMTSPRGPLHINIPLREPLDNSPLPLDRNWEEEIRQMISSPRPSLINQSLEKSPPENALFELIKDLQNAKRPLIIFGPMDRSGQELMGSIKKFLSSYGGSFSCDITSGLKFSFGSEEGLIPALDHPEVLKEIRKASPDLIIHFGHRVTSKHYYSMIGDLVSKRSELKCIQICETHQHEDPGLGFQVRWNINPSVAIKAIEERLSSQGNIQKHTPLIQWDKLIHKKEKIIEKANLCYPVLTKMAVESLTGVEQVFIGNSTFIRSFDSYAALKDPKKKWNILANRGVSGIEGHLAMTQGICEAFKAPTVAFMGDISFIHDLNSLTCFHQMKPKTPLLIILANNQGGGIFKLLPIAKAAKGERSEEYLKLLTTKHNFLFTPLLKALGLEAQTLSTPKDYSLALRKWSKKKRILFLECLFNDEENGKIYDQLQTVTL